MGTCETHMIKDFIDEFECMSFDLMNFRFPLTITEMSARSPNDA